MTDITAFSPAKINLFLHVTGKRPDGYHTLYSLMCRINYGDTLRMRFGEKGLRVYCTHPDVPDGEKNIVHHAASMFYGRLGKTPDVCIDVDKQIPVGAGLGGGSSNAASTLLELNRHHGRPFTRDELMQMGLCSGADVPFFLFGGTALAEGVGEKLKEFVLTDTYKVLIVYPGIHVPTALVYKKLNFELTKDKKKNNNHLFCLLGGVFSPEVSLWNDLEEVTFEMYPEISKIKRVMLMNGADGALMSGSGSSVFGLFSDGEKADSACQTLMGLDQAKRDSWQIVITDLMV